MKCLFDNCLPSRLAKTLDCLEGENGISVTHITDKFSPDIKDIDWMQELGKEDKWFVITRDNMIKKRPHELKAWRESKLLIVFLKKNWINYNFWEISWRLIKYWPEIKKNVSSIKSSSIILGINGKIEFI